MATDQPPTVSLPLFLLHTTLLPGASMTLRVFEPRYLALLRECSRTDSTFGVCLILDGEEVGDPATPAAWGVEATIEDFDVGADGMLRLTLRGARRFHITAIGVRENGLVMGEVVWQPADDDEELRPEHAMLGMLLERILDHVGGVHAKAIGTPVCEQAAWVSWRLAEMLPLEEPQRLALLQMDDAHQRLEQLLAWIPDSEE